MNILLNGEPKTVDSGLTISGLLEELQLDPKFLAVERNEELVPRRIHQECVLEEDDRIEIVTLVGGG